MPSLQLVRYHPCIKSISIAPVRLDEIGDISRPHTRYIATDRSICGILIDDRQDSYSFRQIDSTLRQR